MIFGDAKTQMAVYICTFMAGVILTPVLTELTHLLTSEWALK